MNSACLSRCITWFETSAASIPRYSMVFSCIRMPFFPNAACVPTAPLIFPTVARGVNWSSLSICRSISEAHIAKRRPYVVGTPIWPCVRPAHTVFLWDLSLIHISEPTRLRRNSYAVLCLKKKKKKTLRTERIEKKKEEKKKKEKERTRK